MMHWRLAAALSLLCFWAIVNAQAPLVYDDFVYVPNIKTPNLHVTGLETSPPIIELGTMEGLELSFDDLDNQVNYYTYTVIHCDRDWKPSNLMFQEYASGFEDEEIVEFSYSVGTLVPFTHYRLRIPNRNCELKLSGNYIIAVYANSNRDRPVLTRRFMVVEPLVVIDPSRVRPSNVAKMNTHHEIRFNLDIKELQPPVRNPKEDITCAVMQNGRWDKAYTGVSSRREVGDVLYFDWVDRITFGAGKEFRSMDIRSTQYRSRDVFEIERLETHTVIYGKLDRPRAYATFLSVVDANGYFVIRTTDFPGEIVHPLRADYAEVVFSLEVDQPYLEDVYVFGKMSDWQLREDFKMTYDSAAGGYIAAPWLKQGFYDYIYVLANSDGSADEATIEGHWFESSNRYQILVYYRPFGARYDRLVGAVGF